MYWMDGKMLQYMLPRGRAGRERGNDTCGDPTPSWLEITPRILLHCREKHKVEMVGVAVEFWTLRLEERITSVLLYGEQRRRGANSCNRRVRV
jgi:hypothetical protein